MKTMHFKSRNQQHGLSLLLVLVLLVITISTSLYFYDRMVTSTRVSGATRDNSASLMMAESAMEALRGRFINSMDSLCNGQLDSSAECSEISYDKIRAYPVIKNMDDTSGLDAVLDSANVDYMFFVGTDGITETTPSILQSVANGAATAQDGTFCTVGSRAISATTCNLKINDLYNAGDGYSPLLYTTNDNGRLIESTAGAWNTAFANKDTVATVWMELTVNAADPSAVDIWVQAAARVGMATSYIQRYLGTYYPSNVLGSLSGLVEASNIDRRETP